MFSLAKILLIFHTTKSLEDFGNYSIISQWPSSNYAMRSVYILNTTRHIAFSTPYIYILMRSQLRVVSKIYFNSLISEYSVQY